MLFSKDNRKNIIEKLFNNNPKSGLSLSPRKYFIRDLIIVIGVVLVWRGTWGLIDLYFFPDHPVWSYVIGIALGLFLLFLPSGDFSHLSGTHHHDEHKHH